MTLQQVCQTMMQCLSCKRIMKLSKGSLHAVMLLHKVDPRPSLCLTGIPPHFGRAWIKLKYKMYLVLTLSLSVVRI